MKPSRIVEKLKRLEKLICNVNRETLAINKDLWKKALNEAADLIEGLIPRPIEEAPEDGTHFVGLTLDGFGSVFHYFTDGKMYLSWNKNANDADFNTQFVTHFIPLSAIQKLMER